MPFFAPIVASLRARGQPVILTARDGFQVRELADQAGLDCTFLGHHPGAGRVRKVLSYLVRGARLLPTALRHRPVLGVSHGARSQIMACRLAGIPSVELMDYEHAVTPPLARPDWEIIPRAIEAAGFVRRARRGVLTYSGLKEDVYADGFVPDRTILRDLSLEGATFIATVRPPATEAHYHNAESEELLDVVMAHLLSHDGARVVLLPRNSRQGDVLRTARPGWFVQNRTTIPTAPVNGLNLIWHSDVVVSGGGTMNREAAALDVPVFSIFRGPIGAIDKHLAAEGRLTLIACPAEVPALLRLRRRERLDHPSLRRRTALHDILAHLEHIIQAS